ncbi:MAG: hypothetical protein WC645_07235 [Candidatus Margulisiibacteriota bacterium]
MKSYFKILAVSCMLLAVSAPLAQAVTFNSTGNPGDTVTTTVIIAASTFETLGYLDLNGTRMTTVEPASGNNSQTVGSEFGFSGPGSPSDNTVTPGDVAYHYYAVTNEGNASDNYTLYHVYSQYNGATGWVVEVWEGAGRIVTLEAGTSANEVRAVAEDAEKTFYYKIIVPSSVAQAPNGSYITITSTVEAAGTPVGQYTGGNALTYGGASTATDPVTDTTAAPLLTLTRTSTVDSPTAAAGYTGTIHDAVPGAVITFTLTYSNSGNASAESVILVDRVPVNTKLAHFNTTGTGSNVNLTAAQGNATGWTIKYSTLANPSKVYGNTADWSGGSGGTIGSLTTGSEEYPGGSATYATGDAPYGAAWIKWEKASIDPTDDNKTLTWGATIR